MSRYTCQGCGRRTARRPDAVCRRCARGVAAAPLPVVYRAPVAPTYGRWESDGYRYSDLGRA